MDQPQESSTGLVATLKRLFGTLLAIAENRLELLLVELAEERWRVVAAVLLGAGVVVGGLMTLVTVTFLVMVIFWDHRVAAASVVTAIYLAATFACVWQLRKRLKSWQSFSATLSELRKDRQWWAEQTSND